MSPIETRAISDPAAFDAVAADWDAVILGSARPSPFMLADWLRPWWSVYMPTTTMRFMMAYESGRMVGALPLRVTGRIARAGRLGRFLAIGDAAIAGAPGADVVAALAAGIAREPIDVVDLNGIASDSQLATHMPGEWRVAERSPAPILDMPDGWDAAYRRITSSKTRNTHTRRLKQLSNAGTVTFHRYTTEPDIAAALEDAFRVHALRWGERREIDTSPFGTPAGQAYQRRALAAAARVDRARIIELRLDNVPIAFHLYLLLGGVMFVYRLAFDPAYGQFSPGLLTTIEAIRQASAEGAIRVEFQRGGERYKTELSDGAETLIRLVGLPSGIRGAAYVRSAPAIAAAKLRLRQDERILGAYLRGQRLLQRGGS